MSFRSLLVTLSLCVYLVASSASGTAAADSAYIKGDYADAVEDYMKLVESAGQSSELDYNLGNAYARGGDYGNAMLWYLRALRLNPSNENARKNVEYIDHKVADANKSELKSKKLSVEHDSPSFFGSVRNYIESDHLSDTWAYWAAGFFIAFVACLALYLFTQNVLLRKIGFFGGISCVGAALITVVFAFMAAGYVSAEGVILSPKVKLHSEPNYTSNESPVFLTRGTRLSILDRHPAGDAKTQWWKVRLNSDYVGWINAGDFAPVEQ